MKSLLIKRDENKVWIVFWNLKARRKLNWWNQISIPRISAMLWSGKIRIVHSYFALNHKTAEHVENDKNLSPEKIKKFQSCLLWLIFKISKCKNFSYLVIWPIKPMFFLISNHTGSLLIMGFKILKLWNKFIQILEAIKIIFSCFQLRQKILPLHWGIEPQRNFSRKSWFDLV